MKLSNNAIVAVAVVAAAGVMPMPSASGYHVQADVASRHIASLESTRLFPGIDFQDEIDPATMSHSPDPALSKEGRRVGKAFVFPAFIQKLQQATGKAVNVPEGEESHEVQTLYITETTDRHVDSVARGHKRNPLKASDADGSLTAFYVQESSAGAFFDTEDDEMCLPLVEGNVVYFNGGLPHHTVLNKAGAIKLFGPFLVSSLEAVGCDSCGCPNFPPCPSPKDPPPPPPSPTGPAPKTPKAPPTPKAPKSHPAPTRDRKLESSGTSFSPMIGVTFAASIVALGALFY